VSWVAHVSQTHELHVLVLCVERLIRHDARELMLMFGIKLKSEVKSVFPVLRLLNRVVAGATCDLVLS
jgi:hypothetical protein